MTANSNAGDSFRDLGLPGRSFSNVHVASGRQRIGARGSDTASAGTSRLHTSSAADGCPPRAVGPRVGFDPAPAIGFADLSDSDIALGLTVLSLQAIQSRHGFTVTSFIASGRWPPVTGALARARRFTKVRSANQNRRDLRNRSDRSCCRHWSEMSKY
jgi:hypothetical protein